MQISYDRDMKRTDAITDLQERIELLDEQQLQELLYLVGEKFPKVVKEPAKPQRQLGALKGMLVYMADDFDEPLDCFKEYMSSRYFSGQTFFTDE